MAVIKDGVPAVSGEGIRGVPVQGAEVRAVLPGIAAYRTEAVSRFHGTEGRQGLYEDVGLIAVMILVAGINVEPAFTVLVDRRSQTFQRFQKAEEKRGGQIFGCGI